MLLFFICGSATVISHGTGQGGRVLTAELQKVADALTSFPLGKFLWENRGLNGEWTSHLIRNTTSENSTELRLLHAPSVRATRERFGIFQQQLSKHIQPGTNVASIPCGVMDDLLTLNDVPEGVSFYGYDLDQNSLDIVRSRPGGQEVHLKHQDAWNLGIEDKLDVIMSNGLNIYEKDDTRVTELYRGFCAGLKPGGFLITSFLTPRDCWRCPDGEDKSVWEENLAWQKMVFSEVLQVQWQHFRTEATTEQQLKDAGFEVIEFIHDTQGIFPTVIARKP